MSQFSAPPQFQYAVPPTAQTISPMAIVSFVLGILGFCTGGLLGVVGVILGIVAISGINRSQGARGGKGLAIAGISVGACSLVSGCLFAGILLPAIGKARATAIHTRFIMSARELGTANATYTSDNQELFPPTDSWVDEFGEYFDIEDMQPLVAYPKDEDDLTRAFAMNASLEGLKTTDVDESYRTVLFFECAPSSPMAGGPELMAAKPRFSAGYVIVFVDGHTDVVHPKELGTLVWKP